MSHPAATAVSAATETDGDRLSFDSVAKKLLHNRLLLTALELHAELVERGESSARLTRYFADPANFLPETALKTEQDLQLVRSSSQSTLDSVEMTRFSEVDDQCGCDADQMALLQFELRKAHETIRSLRAELTGVAELTTHSDQQRCDSARDVHDATITRPHERRAINFLLNEYLLAHGYKLSSIAFADENDNQMLDDWDDVGLNVVRPPSLLSLYRSRERSAGVTRDCSCQTDILDSSDGTLADYDRSPSVTNQSSSQPEAVSSSLLDHWSAHSSSNTSIAEESSSREVTSLTVTPAISQSSSSVCHSSRFVSNPVCSPSQTSPIDDVRLINPRVSSVGDDSVDTTGTENEKSDTCVDVASHCCECVGSEHHPSATSVHQSRDENIVSPVGDGSVVSRPVHDTTGVCSTQRS